MCTATVQFIHSLCWVLLHCFGLFNGYLFLAMKQAMTKEDNEAWNCPSQRNHRHGVRIPWGGLSVLPLIKLGHSFHTQGTSEQHWILLSGFRTPYGNCLGCWLQAKEWQFFSPFIFLYPVMAHIWKSYTYNLPSAQFHVLLMLCMLQYWAEKYHVFSCNINKSLI